MLFTWQCCALLWSAVRALSLLHRPVQWVVMTQDAKDISVDHRICMTIKCCVRGLPCSLASDWKVSISPKYFCPCFHSLAKWPSLSKILVTGSCALSVTTSEIQKIFSLVWALWASVYNFPSYILSMTSYVVKYPLGQPGSAALAVSPPSFLWKLTLSQPKPGHQCIRGLIFCKLLT